MSRLSAFLFLALAACAGGGQTISDYAREPVPGEEARVKALRAAEAQRRDFQKVLIDLDQAMESYAKEIAFRGSPRADSKADQLETMIRRTVLDEGFATYGEVDVAVPRTSNFTRLQATAVDGSQPEQQGVALAALGFSGRPEVMDTIAQGAMLDNPVLIDRAVFGLAMLRAPSTPPGILAAVVENEKLPIDVRAQAAWALYQLQETSRRRDEIVAIWRRYAGPDRDKIPELALVQAVRGLGLTRDAANADLVVPFLQSPLPLVRMAAAGAIGRMNAQDHGHELLALIGPDETNANVRLHARKALQALVGYADYEYDVEAWRRAFERK